MLINYIPARLTEGKNWYVSYYVINPTNDKLVRKRIKLDRIKLKPERRKFARQLIHKINIKLAEGWNPFIEQESPKSFHKLFDAIEIYLRIKERELRKDSMRTYTSYAKKLTDYLEKNHNGKRFNVIDFNQRIAVEYLNDLYVKHRISEVVYNNHRNFGRLLFNWLIENQYCKANPFVGIKSKREKEKTRIPVSEAFRTKIKAFLEQKNEYEYLSICMLTYYTFLRPIEICQLKPSMFNLQKQIIDLPPEICKDHSRRIVTIPNQLLPYLERLEIDKMNPKFYVYSTSFKPGKVLKNSRDIAKRWDKLRNELKMPKEMQFYSLKDTGIIQMLQSGVSPEVVRDQAGHSSLEVTNKYVKLATGEADSQIKLKSGGF